jgi:hypothetical protein
MFWNTDYNAVAALPALFDVFLRDTQKVRAAARLLYPRALLHLPTVSLTYFFCPPSLRPYFDLSHSLDVCSSPLQSTPTDSSAAHSCSWVLLWATCKGQLLQRAAAQLLLLLPPLLPPLTHIMHTLAICLRTDSSLQHVQQP